MYRIKHLTPSEIPDAQSLLYDIYYKEQNWTPALNNPSNLRYENQRLRDDFEDKAAWFGVYRGKRIVGTLRVITEELELSRYISLSIKNAAELNRTAVVKEYRKTFVLPILMIAAYIHTIRKGCPGIYGAVSLRAARRAARDSWEFTGINFKFDRDDAAPCHVVYISMSWKLFFKYLFKYVLRSLC